MIKIYKTRTCHYCRMVGEYLTKKNVDFEFIDITDDHKTRLKLQETTGATTVPITFNGNKFVIGYDIRKLARLING